MTAERVATNSTAKLHEMRIVKNRLRPDLRPAFERELESGRTLYLKHWPEFQALLEEAARLKVADPEKFARSLMAGRHPDLARYTMTADGGAYARQRIIEIHGAGAYQDQDLGIASGGHWYQRWVSKCRTWLENRSTSQQRSKEGITR